ncbi:MAG: hypothetical protein HC765_09215 [Brachymonas sp.]|nr:hypothetical protein [Brachymonas sp.]
MQAHTTGWITVGFHTRPTLAGARLVMGRGFRLLAIDSIALCAGFMPANKRFS